MNRETEGNPVGCVEGGFGTTHWGVVLEAANGDCPKAALALEKLCSTYWHPLYTFVRRRGFGKEDAQDIIQGFFLQLLAHASFKGVNPAKGRFRSFLLAALDFYIADHREKAHALKRGGGQLPVPFDFEEAEARYGLALADNRSPDKAFERQWAMTILERVLLRLEQEFRDASRDQLFSAIKPYLVETDRSASYAVVALRLGVSEEVIKKSVQRMRRRYGAMVREEIAHTLSDPAELEDELRYLRAVMAG